MSHAVIAYIGGGSADWAVKLMRDLAREPEFSGILRLYDIDRPAAVTNLELGRRIFAHPDAKASFEVSIAETPAAALGGADIVVLSIEPGPTTCRYADLEIPAKHGILQPVGDTVGPGGLLRAWRAVPTFIEYARRIAQYAPHAWVINYTNPMTLCTAALYRGFPKIKAVGCCHEDRYAQLPRRVHQLTHRQAGYHRRRDPNRCRRHQPFHPLLVDYCGQDRRDTGTPWIHRGA